MSKNKSDRKSKYYTHVKPRLKEIEAWARNGLTDEQIAKNLGIAYSTFRKYRDEHSALSASLKKGKEVVDIEVENALLKRALGYDYEEIKTLIEEVDGKKKKKVEKVTRHVPADVSAGIFWLRNRKGFVWSNRDAIEAKRIEAEIEKLKAETEKLKNENSGAEPPKITIVDEWSSDNE
mgnify:CR=1 FL=1